MQILFFDDEGVSENELFILRLKRKTGVGVEIAKTVRQFETMVRTAPWLALVLDIMAHPPADFVVHGSEPPEFVRAAQTGLELLRRCRSGYYGDAVQRMPIYMRSARGEEHIVQKALAAGASGYFDAAGRDEDLIREIGGLS